MLWTDNTDGGGLFKVSSFYIFAKKAVIFMKGSEKMDWMNVHLFVASCVYAALIILGIILFEEACVWLCNKQNRAKLKRKMKNILRNILKKFIKTES